MNSEFASNTSDHEPQVVRIGLPRPTIVASRSPAGNAAGWNNSDVVVSFTCVDPLSALSGCPAEVRVSAEGRDQSVTVSSTLKGGGTVTATVDGISIDKTKPVISYTGNAGTYAADEFVHISCLAADGLSDVTSTTCSDIDGPGVLLYELLTGKTPVDEKELLASGIRAMRKTKKCRCGRARASPRNL